MSPITTAETRGVTMKWSALLLAAAHVSACNCGPRPGRDGGVDEDAGFDAGGEVDSGTPMDDAGVPDAGPAPVLRILNVLPPRGSSAGGTSVTLTGSAFLRNFAGSGSQAMARAISAGLPRRRKALNFK